jgi:hypothetical protein
VSRARNAADGATGADFTVMAKSQPFKSVTLLTGAYYKPSDPPEPAEVGHPAPSSMRNHTQFCADLGEQVSNGPIEGSNGFPYLRNRDFLMAFMLRQEVSYDLY